MVMNDLMAYIKSVVKSGYSTQHFVHSHWQQKGWKQKAEKNLAGRQND